MKRKNIFPRDLPQPKPTLVPRLRLTFSSPRLAILEHGRGAISVCVSFSLNPLLR